MRRSRLLLPLFVVVSLLAGCGNKGPLVMPSPAAAAPSATSAPAVPAAASTAPPAARPR